MTNSGDTDLTNVTVTDPLAPACDNVVGDLTIGASATYTCDLAGVIADFTNVASVVADTPLGVPIGDSDDALVDVIVAGVIFRRRPMRSRFTPATK